MDPHQRNPDEPNNQFNIAMRSSDAEENDRPGNSDRQQANEEEKKAEQNADAAAQQLREDARQPLWMINFSFNQPPIQNQQAHNPFEPRPTLTQQIEDLRSRRIPSTRDQQIAHPPQDQNQIQGNVINQSPFQSSTSKKRNFRKLLEQHDQLPQELYFPRQEEVELQNQFKKLKLSHDVEVRESVQNAEREAVQSQANQLITLRQEASFSQSQALPENQFQFNRSQLIDPQYLQANYEQSSIIPNLNQINGSQPINPFYLQSNNKESSLIPSQHAILQERSPDPRGQQSRDGSPIGHQRERSSKRLASRASRGLYNAGAISEAQEQDDLIEELYQQEILQSVVNDISDNYNQQIQGQMNNASEPRKKKKLSKLQSRTKYHSQMRGNTTYGILLDQDPHIANLPIKDVKQLLKQRSSVQFAMKVKIVELRFGRYGQLEPVRMSITNIAKKVSIARSTVYKIIQQYKVNDGMISGLPEKQQRKKILTEEVAAVLKDPKTLREWAHLSLEARCAILKEQHDIQISRYTLSNYYKQLQVGYLKTHSSFYSARSEEETARLRVEYIKKIVGHMRRNREIIYMDETTTDMWAIRNKIWQPKDSVLPLVIQRAQKKENNVTIIGAISQRMKIIFHHVTYSTNKDTVENFYKKYHRKFNLQEKVIVMDNHRAHGANVVRDFLDEKGAIIEFLPPCSSYFNPIETVWSWVKGKWKNSLMQAKDLHASHQEWIQEELSRICSSCPQQVIQNIVKSCSRLMIKYLRQYDPGCEEIHYLERMEDEEQQSRIRNLRAELQELQDPEQIHS